MVTHWSKDVIHVQSCLCMKSFRCHTFESTPFCRSQHIQAISTLLNSLLRCWFYIEYGLLLCRSRSSTLEEARCTVLQGTAVSLDSQIFHLFNIPHVMLPQSGLACFEGYYCIMQGLPLAPKSATVLHSRQWVIALSRSLSFDQHRWVSFTHVHTHMHIHLHIGY